jgi:hypothetical protein
VQAFLAAAQMGQEKDLSASVVAVPAAGQVKGLTVRIGWLPAFFWNVTSWSSWQPWHPFGTAITVTTAAVAGWEQVDPRSPRALAPRCIVSDLGLDEFNLAIHVQLNRRSCNLA